MCIRGKANGDINIPRQFSQEIDLSNFCFDDVTDIALQYRLVSMVIQSTLGQYTAILYAKDGTYLECIEFNDRPITHDCMLDVSRFVAFYELNSNDSTVSSTNSFIDTHSTILSTENSFGLNDAFVNYEMDETPGDSNTVTNEDSWDESFNNTVVNKTRSSACNSGERNDCTKDNNTNETTAQSAIVPLVNESEKKY